MKIFTTLFILGLVIEAAAFFVNQFENIPFVNKLISPKYFHAVNGLKKMEYSMVIEPNDIGFSEFREIFHNLLREQYPLIDIASVSVLKFQREGASLGLSQKRAKELIPIKVFVSNGKKISWDLEGLTKGIEKFEKKNAFIISVFIFVFGASLQAVGFIIELNKKS